MRRLLTCFLLAWLGLGLGGAGAAERISWDLTTHTLNHPPTCLGWWLVTPTPLSTSTRWLDLIARRVGTLVGMGLYQSQGSGLNRPPSLQNWWGTMAFDGTNDRVDTVNVLNNPSTMSLSVWFRTTRITRQALITKAVAYNGTNLGWSLRTQIGGDNAQLSFWLNQNAASQYAGISGGAAVADDRWHHVVVTMAAWASPATNWALWVDGVQQTVSVSTLGTLTSVSNSEVVRFGSFGNGSDPFYGELNDIRLFTRVLTRGEILDLWSAPRTAYETFLWPARFTFGLGTADPRQRGRGLLFR